MNELATDDILTMRETARLLKVSSKTIYNMMKDGRLQGFMPKGAYRWYFSKKAIENYLNGGSEQ